MVVMSGRGIHIFKVIHLLDICIYVTNYNLHKTKTIHNII